MSLPVGLLRSGLSYGRVAFRSPMYLISEKASSEIRGRDVLILWLWRHALVFVAPNSVVVGLGSLQCFHVELEGAWYDNVMTSWSRPAKDFSKRKLRLT